MLDENLKIVVSGLLHDVGKIVYRTGDGRQHSLTGMEFLRDEAGIHDKDILDAVRYHHGAELGGAHISQVSSRSAAQEDGPRRSAGPQDRQGLLRLQQIM